MIKEYLEKIRDNIYGKNAIDKGVNLEQIEACEKRLNIKLPIPLKELYEVFGNDKNILTAYHKFIALNDLQIIDNAIIYFELIDSFRKYGVLIENLEIKDPMVNMKEENDDEWYVEAKFISENILNNIFWNGINLMKIKAKIKIKEENLEDKLNNILYKISNERKFSRGIKYSYYDKKEKVMATYFHYDEVLILGANNKESLKKIEDTMNVKFEWIERKVTNNDIFN